LARQTSARLDLRSGPRRVGALCQPTCYWLPCLCPVRSNRSRVRGSPPARHSQNSIGAGAPPPAPPGLWKLPAYGKACPRTPANLRYRCHLGDRRRRFPTGLGIRLVATHCHALPASARRIPQLPQARPAEAAGSAEKHARCHPQTLRCRCHLGGRRRRFPAAPWNSPRCSALPRTTGFSSANPTAPAGDDDHTYILQ
jgi:hypothetical protein